MHHMIKFHRGCSGISMEQLFSFTCPNLSQVFEQQIRGPLLRNEENTNGSGRKSGGRAQEILSFVRHKSRCWRTSVPCERADNVKETLRKTEMNKDLHFLKYLGIILTPSRKKRKWKFPQLVGSPSSRKKKKTLPKAQWPRHSRFHQLSIRMAADTSCLRQSQFYNKEVKKWG